VCEAISVWPAFAAEELRVIDQIFQKAGRPAIDAAREPASMQESGDRD
jgi:hypothetical protein